MMRKKIAVIGSGISGLSAAFYLRKNQEVTLYEQKARLGGHSRTISINHHSGHTIDVDTGFIVLNDRTYPLLNRLFEELGIEIVKTWMSFGVSVNQGETEWALNSLDTFFAQRKQIFSPSMFKGAIDVWKFNKAALRIVKQQTALQDPNLSLIDFINSLKLGSWFKNRYLFPMGGAIWSCSAEQMMQFPASTLIHFFHNHGLLDLANRPQWYTLKNKSIDYVNRIEKSLACVKKGVDITEIHRKKEGVHIRTKQGDHAVFDEIIFACHPENFLPLLQDTSPTEREILSKFSRQKNIAYTHSDETQMPKRKKCWSCWNYLYEDQTPSSSVSITYWMNRLQHIPSHSPLFVTLNPIRPISENKIYDVCQFEHPLFDKNAIDGQRRISLIQGINRTWFCGAYLRYGFHEDGIWSAIDLLEKMHAIKE